MKKILIATTALFAVSAAGVASAAERPVGTIGGYMFFGLGLSDSTRANGGTDDSTEVGILRDGEIHLGWQGSADNGLTFTGRVELEAFTSNDQIDENWAQVSGSFGSVLVGSNDTAGDNYGDVGIFCAAGCRLTAYDGFIEVPMAGSDDGTDALGIRYATPTIAGFTLAASYHPDWGVDGAADAQYATSGSRTGDFDNVVSLAGNYEGEFSGFGVAVGGDYTFGDDSDGVGGDMNIWSVGTEVSFAGFAVGAHYEDSERGGLDGEDLLINASYSTGPWTFAGGWVMSDGGIVGNANGATTVSDGETYAGWVSYAIAPGVAGHLGVMYGESENGDADDNGYNAYAIMSVAF